MQKPQPNEYDPGYQKYFDLLPEGNYLDTLLQNKLITVDFFENIPGELLNYRYAPGKWTIKDLLMHIMDTERVFSHRGLMAARGDNLTPVHRMDEKLYAAHANVRHRTIQSLLAEFVLVRHSTAVLFENFTENQHTLWCNIVSHPMTTRAIGYFIIGHDLHHINVIKEKYLR